jgi:hypothetical protein
MDEAGFREFLKEGKRVPKDLDAKTIRANIKVVKDFESFLRGRGKGRRLEKAKGRDARAFMVDAVEEGKGDFASFLGLLRYARFTGNTDMETGVLNALDGAKVMDDLCEVVRKKHGKKRYDEVLGGFRSPPIGTDPKRMPRTTREFTDRLESGLGEEGTREVLLVGVHAGLPKYYEEERRMLLASKDVDEYMRKRRERMVKLLEEHMKNGTPFYNQMIDQDALDFVRRNPEVAGGVRRGKKIHQTKIPYMMIEYLREKDPKMKRYYGCHCLLARESILSGEEMSRNLCYCSAGYEKMPYEVAFRKPVKTEVLKSILWGDEVCRFAMEIPEGYLPRKKGKPRA